MRQGTMPIAGVKYPACISARVIINAKERTGKEFPESIADLVDNNNIEGQFWLLAQMLKAGKLYLELIGETSPEPPTEDELLDLIGLDDFQKLANTIIGIANDTSTPDVIVESKNRETTTAKA